MGIQGRGSAHERCSERVAGDDRGVRPGSWRRRGSGWCRCGCHWGRHRVFGSAARGGGPESAVAAVEAAGGEVVKENANLGTLTVRAAASGFVSRVSASSVIEGAARSRPIGSVPRDKPLGVESENGGTGRAAAAKPAVGMDPLDAQLWGLRMVRSDLARQVQPGKKAVKVGVLDSGIDARNPDIAPNFDWKLSRNFAPDIPEIDGVVRVQWLRRPGRLGRQRSRYPRGRHDRRRGQRRRRLRCRAERDTGGDPRRSGQRLPVPRPGHRRPDVRR